MSWITSSNQIGQTWKCEIVFFLRAAHILVGARCLSRSGRLRLSISLCQVEGVTFQQVLSIEQRANGPGHVEDEQTTKEYKQLISPVKQQNY